MGLFLFLFLVLIYFIPTAIAYWRGHRQTGAILALNLLLGWTFIGWVVACVWALINGAEEQKPARSLAETRGRADDWRPQLIRSTPDFAAFNGNSGYRAPDGRWVDTSVQVTSITPEASSILPRMIGDGAFMFDIVGESFYRDAIEEIMTEKEGPYPAELRFEPENPHDAFAVAVFVENEKVGHLDRQHARLFHEQMARRGKVFATQAEIKGHPGGPMGVKLDIRLPFRTV